MLSTSAGKVHYEMKNGILQLQKAQSNVSSVYRLFVREKLMFLSDEGPTLKTLHFALYIGSTRTFYINAAHTLYTFISPKCTTVWITLDKSHWTVNIWKGFLPLWISAVCHFFCHFLLLLFFKGFQGFADSIIKYKRVCWLIIKYGVAVNSNSIVRSLSIVVWWSCCDDSEGSNLVDTIYCYSEFYW